MENFGVGIVPETQAQAIGFTKAIDAAPGLYAMIDIGATTIDACTFEHRKGTTRDNEMPLYKADVKPLGVEAYHWFIRDGRTEQDFVRQCELMLKNVIGKTRIDRFRSAECWKAGNELTVFLMGGGAQNRLHKKIVSDLHDWLCGWLNNEGIGIAKIDTAPVNTETKIHDMGRMAVAWGLSYSLDEIGKPLPPGVIDDEKKPEVLDFEKLFILKEYT